eukprot:TRINITY_DN4307_c0_g2_i1.p1 TRINITY_DN4307_c0_g2~~TRINITY_DN4307_c0_g2_i1.p1  ORF type:complete len:151 (+),score=36.76 TRINITY_DN4307_c0_g2_i1:413-865(+)
MSTSTSFKNVPPLNPTDDLLGHVKRLRQHDDQGGDGFTREYEEILLATEDMETDPETRYAIKTTKNRYHNVLPYKDTRVTLEVDEDDTEPDADYINANYINGEIPGTTREYISTQGPVDASTVDFWKMVWQQKSKVIAMLTRFVEDNKVC